MRIKIPFFLILLLAGFHIRYAGAEEWSLKRRQLAAERQLPEAQYGRMNPFALFDEKKGEAAPQSFGPVLKLTGITWSESSQNALINNQFLQPGDIIAGYAITAIEKDKVLLTKDGKKYKLTSSSLVELDSAVPSE